MLGTAAIFSIADALLLRPRVGIANPARVVDIGRSNDGQGMDNIGYPLFAAMRSESRLMASLSAHRLGPDVMSLGDATASERVFAGLVSGNYFETLGTRPALGRFFLAEEDATADTHPVVVLSHAFWARRFDSRADVVGQTHAAEQPALHGDRRGRARLHGYDDHRRRPVGADGDGRARTGERPRRCATITSRCG